MNHDNYELPSIYNQKTGHFEPVEDLQRDNSFDIRIAPSHQQALLDDDHIEDVVLRKELSLNNASNMDRQLAWLLLYTPIAILVFTVVPAVATLPNVNSMTTGDAIYRLVDPLFTLPPFLFTMFCSNITRYHDSQASTLIWLVWTIGAGIYVQGHGVHLSAALFKHPVQDFTLAHSQTLASEPGLLEELEAIYSYMRNLWEHIIGHYMYAAGAIIMSWTQIAAFCDQIHGPLTTGYKVVFCVSSLIYGLLIAAISIDFPYGCYVGLPYSIILGIVCVFLIVTRRKNELRNGGLLSLGRRMVLQYYLGASVVALIIIIGWLGKYGFANRSVLNI